MKPIKVTNQYLRRLRKSVCSDGRAYLKAAAHPREAWEQCVLPYWMDTALTLLEQDCSPRSNDLRHARIRVRLLTRFTLSDGSTVASHIPDDLRFLLDAQIAFLRSRISKAQMGNTCAGFLRDWDALQKGIFSKQYVPDLELADLCVFASTICNDFDWTIDVVRHIDSVVREPLPPDFANLNSRICAVIRDCVPLEFESEGIA